MKCKLCGGELLFQDGVYVCKNCNNTYQLDYGFENIDVYICYTESNAQGGRTKDSAIADELYQKLSHKKVETFYERKSAATLYGDDLQAANYQVIYHAKIILIVGTTTEHFDLLLSKYAEYFKEKTVIPLYADIRPENLPHTLRQLQALNFDSIGADADLIKRIFTLLGKDNDTEFKPDATKKSKAKIITICTIILLAIVGVATVALLHLKSSVIDKANETTDQEVYDSAQALLDSGDYLGAADLFLTIPTFKNSANLCNDIYDRYDGYYISTDKNITFYINIQNASTADFIVEKAENSKKVRFEESAKLNNRTISASFIDSLNNSGKITIMLDNESINVTTVIDNENEVFSIGNQSTIFKVIDKSDRPIEQSVTSDILMQWTENKTYLENLKQAGYPMEFYKTVTAGGGINEHFAVYKIKNTDIKLLLADFDLTSTNSYLEIENNILKDFYIVGIIAPAEVAVPQKIGNISRVYEENNILYIPKADEFMLNAELDSGSVEYCTYFSFYENSYETTIESDTLIGISSKTLIGENLNWIKKYLIEDFSSASAISQFKTTHSDSTQNYYISGIVEASNESSDLICVECRCPDCQYKYYFYKHNQSTGKTEFIAELFDDSDSFRGAISSKYPELFEEFY